MDGVSYAWKQGQHARTPSGYTAGCSDCHLLNETNRPLTPVAYVELLFAKAKAGSISGFGELRGTLNTPQMWLEKRPELSKNVTDWMVSYNFRNCRGCHNLADMYNAKNRWLLRCTPASSTNRQTASCATRPPVTTTRWLTKSLRLQANGLIRPKLGNRLTPLLRNNS